MTVFDNIKRISKQRGYSLQTTAEKAGLSKNAIYQYNNGKNPSYETLSKIAKVLSVPTSDLIEDGSYKLSLGDTNIPLFNTNSPLRQKNDTNEIDINDLPADEQGIELMAAHWGRDLNNLSDKDRKKVIKKAEAYVLGLIDAYEDKD